MVDTGEKERGDQNFICFWVKYYWPELQTGSGPQLRTTVSIFLCIFTPVLVSLFFKLIIITNWEKHTRQASGFEIFGKIVGEAKVPSSDLFEVMKQLNILYDIVVVKTERHFLEKLELTKIIKLIELPCQTNLTSTIIRQVLVTSIRIFYSN